MTGDVYYNARRTAGLTQERWAELLGVTPETVRQYERGQILPSDEIALRMAEAAGQHIVCYWHLLQKSRAAREILPSVAEKALPEAVLALLARVQEFQRGPLEDLILIAADGKVAEDEREIYTRALQDLRALITAAWELQYAKTEREG